MATSTTTLRHTHVLVRRFFSRQTWCSRCGVPLYLLLLTEAVCEIAREEVPLFWTSWRDPRLSEVARG